jgi:hypothetical protein
VLRPISVNCARNSSREKDHGDLVTSEQREQLPIRIMFSACVTWDRACFRFQQQFAGAAVQHSGDLQGQNQREHVFAALDLAIERALDGDRPEASEDAALLELFSQPCRERRCCQGFGRVIAHTHSAF